MLGQGIAAGFALVIGLATGFFFERRSSRATRAQNEELKRELQQGLRGLGGEAHGHQEPRKHAVDDLEVEILAWARAFQDASGQVETRKVIMHFADLDSTGDDVRSAIARLSESGSIRIDGKWLVLT